MRYIIHFAYLDPGTGSMIIQAVIGVVAGVSLFGRKAIGEMRAKLSRTHEVSKKAIVSEKK